MRTSHYCSGLFAVLVPIFAAIGSPAIAQEDDRNLQDLLDELRDDPRLSKKIADMSRVSPEGFVLGKVQAQVESRTPYAQAIRSYHEANQARQAFAILKLTKQALHEQFDAERFYHEAMAIQKKTGVYKAASGTWKAIKSTVKVATGGTVVDAVVGDSAEELDPGVNTAINTAINTGLDKLIRKLVGDQSDPFYFGKRSESKVWQGLQRRKFTKKNKEEESPLVSSDGAVIDYTDRSDYYSSRDAKAFAGLLSYLGMPADSSEKYADYENVRLEIKNRLGSPPDEDMAFARRNSESSDYQHELNQLLKDSNWDDPIQSALSQVNLHAHLNNRTYPMLRELSDIFVPAAKAPGSIMGIRDWLSSHFGSTSSSTTTERQPLLNNSETSDHLDEFHPGRLTALIDDPGVINAEYGACESGEWLEQLLDADRRAVEDFKRRYEENEFLEDRHHARALIATKRYMDAMSNPDSKDLRDQLLSDAYYFTSKLEGEVQKRLREDVAKIISTSYLEHAKHDLELDLEVDGRFDSIVSQNPRQPGTQIRTEDRPDDRDPRDSPSSSDPRSGKGKKGKRSNKSKGGN